MKRSLERWFCYGNWIFVSFQGENSESVRLYVGRSFYEVPRRIIELVIKINNDQTQLDDLQWTGTSKSLCQTIKSITRQYFQLCHTSISFFYFFFFFTRILWQRMFQSESLHNCKIYFNVNSCYMFREDLLLLNQVILSCHGCEWIDGMFAEQSKHLLNQT